MPVEDFPIAYKTDAGKPMRRHRCAPCQNKITKAWKEKNPDAAKRNYVQKTWGIPLESYELFISKGCEVCGTKEDLVIDHDHSCCPTKGSCGWCIRGVLCRRHNLAEGNLRGNPEEAIKLAEYMKRVNKDREIFNSKISERGNSLS